MKMALVAPGRFHAFDLARTLLARGHDVTVLTNLPSRSVSEFGVPANRVRSFPMNGALMRAWGRMPAGWRSQAMEARLHESFGRWAARTLAGQDWDVVHAWSGVAAETLANPSVRGVKLLMRGSSHIVTQSRLLQDEERRAGVRIDQPSPWMIQRELQEYGDADGIVVLSSFARQSFLENGVSGQRLSVVPLGVDVGGFRPSLQTLQARQARIRDGAPLRVLFVGTLSYQKGLLDLIETIRMLASGSFVFRLVGGVSDEARRAVAGLGATVELVGRVPERDLLRHYAASDVFVFPTIQDGFAMVLAQAHAAGLPIVATTNCGAADVIDAGRSGWVVPIRDPGAIVERLRICESNREALATMTQRIFECVRTRDWADVARDFESVCARALSVGEPVALHG